MRPTTSAFAALLASVAFLGLFVDVTHSEMTSGHLMWMFQAKSGYAPCVVVHEHRFRLRPPLTCSSIVRRLPRRYDSPFAPVILPGPAPGSDRVIVLSQTQAGQYAVDALDIVSGARIWDAVLPYTNEEDIWPGVESSNPFQYLGNAMNMAFIRVPGVLVAIDGVSGNVVFQWPIPYNTSLTSVSGWDDRLGLMLQGQPIVSPYFPTVLRPTLLGALSTDGSLLWMQNATTALPLSQAEASTYAVETIEGSKEGLLYSRAKKILLLDWNTGDVVWDTSVALEGSVGTGSGANITHLRYVPQHYLSNLAPRILINANNWGFQRFAMLQFNVTNSSAPAYNTWRSKLPENAMSSLELTAPTIDNSPDAEMFYYWSNRTIWNYGEDPVSSRYLVGKRLSDGKETWSTKLEPVGLPSAFHGRVFVTSTEGLEAIQGTSGAGLWSMPGDSISPAFTYQTTPTFSNKTGIMVATRCIQGEVPTLCMYSQFDPANDGAGSYWGLQSLLAALAVTLAVLS